MKRSELRKNGFKKIYKSVTAVDAKKISAKIINEGNEVRCYPVRSHKQSASKGDYYCIYAKKINQ